MAIKIQITRKKLQIKIFSSYHNKYVLILRTVINPAKSNLTWYEFRLFGEEKKICKIPGKNLLVNILIEDNILLQVNYNNTILNIL